MKIRVQFLKLSKITRAKIIARHDVSNRVLSVGVACHFESCVPTILCVGVKTRMLSYLLKQVSQRASKLTHFVRNVTRHASKVHKCPTFLQEYTRLAKYAKIAATIFTRLEVVFKVFKVLEGYVVLIVSQGNHAWELHASFASFAFVILNGQVLLKFCI